MKLCSKCNERPAVVFITRVEGEKSYPEGFCLKCAKELNIGPINDMLKSMNIPDDAMSEINDSLSDVMADIFDEETGEINEEAVNEKLDEFIPGGAATFPFFKNIFPNKNSTPNENPDGSVDAEFKQEKPKEKRENRPKKFKFLEGYCSNLTRRAAEGQIDRIIGRDRETYRVVQILSRRSKNNPCLIGEPGVGKTAIAEGLALKIANGDVPAKLLDKQIYLLDLTALVAGTQFRGQFESRVKGLVEEIKAAGNIILFIDEIHNLVGTGDSEGTMNAANILKPALSRGEIHVIGATTFNEYRKYIEKDAALERRFQPVTVEEPSISDTINILNGVKSYYESHHNVTLNEGIIRTCVELSERYITDRFMPDKAIDLVDEACACASLRNKQADEFIKLNTIKNSLTLLKESIESEEEIDYERLASVNVELAKATEEIEAIPEEALHTDVTFEDIAKVIELWTGIPASKIQENDLRKLINLTEVLKSKIIGQDEAINVISAAVRRSRVQINNKRRPASFIFVGPTGVGKTELVKVLANELFDTPETLIRLDMSEFMEKHSVSRIIGSPPGYVGYDEAGQLTEKVRRKPYSVLLFDEIEKAHPDVLNILLQILDDGRVTDAHGRVVNFENTVIVMTSNAGSDKKENSLGFAKTAESMAKDKAMKALEEILRPEFLGRVDEVVVFKPLEFESLKKIAALMIKDIQEPLENRGNTLEYTEEVLELLAKLSENKPRGARELRNSIRRLIEDKITTLIVENFEKAPKNFSATVVDNEIIVKGK
ncbi:MAG: ATP-dependent Clp protease ATP-binding subunit [Clostridia bacterium]|nr:ATP-dependent Clp protease ATP-binding subunit [Clostridia bacterium]